MKAVLFDAAGTLFRVRGSVGEAYASVAARHGMTADPQAIEDRFRAAFRNMPPMCFPTAAAEHLQEAELAWWRQVVRSAFAGFEFDDFERFFRDLFAYFAQPDSWELFPDVLPALRGLRARHLRLAVVSNFDSRLPPICEGLEIASFFDAIVASSQVGYAKPDPRIFAVALERVGVRPQDALHVGDSEGLDVKGAQAAGLRAILIDRGGVASNPNDRIRDLRGLSSVVV